MTKKPEDKIKDLEAQLAAANEKLAAAAKKEADAPKPSGVKVTKPVKDMPNAKDFPEEGSDGKGNLIKFVKESEVKDFEKQGWKVIK